VIHLNEELLRIANFPHKTEIEPTTTPEEKKVPRVKKVLTLLPHYRPALKVLNLFKDSTEEQDLFEDFKAIDSEIDWIHLPLQDLDTGDIPFVPTLSHRPRTCFTRVRGGPRNTNCILHLCG
jgi:hypothetical protein